MLPFSLDACFEVLAPEVSLLEPLMGLVCKGLLVSPTPVNRIASLAGISLAKLPQLAAALRAGSRAGVFREDSKGQWMTVCTQDTAAQLKLMLRGTNIYRKRIHEDQDIVTVVISKPAEPSRFSSALEKTVEGFTGIDTTAQALIGLAQRARHRLTVMTPFLDESGMLRVLELFEATRSGVRKELIARRPFAPALRNRLTALNLLGVRVYDFRIFREEVGENETFHAKVVRIDDDECYVGSSNMTQWSFHYSLELGFHVKGTAGKRVSQVLDAIIQVSTDVSMLS